MIEERQFKLRIHPVDFAVIYSAMKGITREMAITLERTSRSPIFFAARDFSTAVFDKDGKLLALAEYIPIQVMAAPFAARAVMKYFANEIYDGDLFLVNDPYTFDGGNHLADWTVLTPVFYKGEIMFWSCSRAHQMDVGGGAAGTVNPLARDIWAEGVRIPPIKLWEKGKLRRDIFDMVLANVRVPSMQRGDLLSMIGSARIGHRRLLELVEHYGVETLGNYCLDLQEYTEILMRQEIAKVPPGTYYGEALADGIRDPVSEKIAVRCKLIVEGSDITVDLSESDPQVPLLINSSLSNTVSAVFIALLTSIGKGISYRAEGMMRPVKIITKQGTLAHCAYPAPLSVGTTLGCRMIYEAIWDALAKAVPEITPAGWGPLMTFVATGYDPRYNEMYVHIDFSCSAPGAGAIWGTDGWHCAATTHSCGGLLYPEVEVCELKVPIFWKSAYQFIQDSPGAGRWRSGAAGYSMFTLEAPEGELHQQGNQYFTQCAPCIAGGKPPKLGNKQIIRADGTIEDGRQQKNYLWQKGDTVVCYNGGGCGVGDPLDRDPALMKEDVFDEIISIEGARSDYGVVLDPSSLQVDHQATRKLRREMKKRRVMSERPL